MVKIWDKGSSIDKKIEQFTVGDDFIIDQELVQYDCEASIAHAKMLKKIGILSAIEEKHLIEELQKISQEHKEGKFTISIEDEDCHTAIENRLIMSLGDTGSKIHTGRSRNDQVLVALRLYYKSSLSEISSITNQCIEHLQMFGDKNNFDFPGYTHMQKAMPSNIKIWSNAFADSLVDDLKNLKNAQHIIDQNPLGSGAGYPIPLKIDRELTTSELGFNKIQSNPIYCQISRGKFEALIVDSLSQIMLTLNRLSSDLILFSMPHFGYFMLPEKFCTGSSIMPQKKNPDVLELIRANYHTVNGYGVQVKSLSANLISGYNRDLQLAKKPVISSLNIAKTSLDMMTYIITNLTASKENCLNDLTEDLFATDEVYNLVKEGIPFRDAYRTIAKKLSCK